MEAKQKQTLEKDLPAPMLELEGIVKD